MNPTSLLIALQAAATLLTGLQNNPQATDAMRMQAITAASQTVQMATQIVVMPTIPFPMPQKTGIWTSMDDLRNAAYRDAGGKYVPFGASMALFEEYTSFGDLNSDGLDDAAVIVRRNDMSGNPTFALAAMLHESTIIFDIADMPLGKTVQIFSHHVIGGEKIVIDMQIDGQPRATHTYQLIGNQIMEI